MAWKDTLQDAQFKGQKFDVMNTSESVEHALSEHSYPFKDGVDIEDLGRRHRNFTLKAVIWGDAYEKKLQALIKVLDEAGTGELIHPIYGSIPNVQVKNYKISHESDNVDYCEIDIELVESTAGVEFFTQTLPSQKIQLAKMAQLKAQGLSISMFAGALNGLKGNLAMLDGLKGSILNGVMSIKNTISGAFSLITNAINAPFAFCADIAYAAKGLLTMKSFSALTFKSDLRSIKSSFSSFIKVDNATKTVATTAKQSPTPSVNQILNIKNNNINNTEAVSNTTNKVTRNVNNDDKPSVVSVVSSPDDLVNTTIKCIIVTELSSEVCDVFSRELEAPTLSPDDINNVANDIRLSIDDAVESVTKTYPDSVDRYELIRALKSAAFEITAAAQTVVEIRPPLVQKEVDRDTNLHLLSFSLYGDFKRADEILRLNPAIRNPNKLNKGTVINVYQR